MKDFKFMEMTELSSLSDADLKKELISTQKALFEAKMKLKLGELKQTHKMKWIRRQVARIKTLAKNKDFNIC